MSTLRASRCCALALCLVSLACGAAPRGASDRDVDEQAFDVTRIVDQSGAAFDWVCDEEATCAIMSIAAGSPGAPPCEDSIANGNYGFYFHVLWGRFVQVTAMCELEDPFSSVRGIGEGAWRRLVVCDSDSDCPQPFAETELEPDPGDYVCHSGYCQAENVDDYPRDVVIAREAPTLCFGTQPRYTSPLGTPQTRDAVASVCSNASDGDGLDARCSGPLPEFCPDPR